MTRKARAAAQHGFKLYLDEVEQMNLDVFLKALAVRGMKQAWILETLLQHLPASESTADPALDTAPLADLPVTTPAIEPPAPASPTQRRLAGSANVPPIAAPRPPSAPKLPTGNRKPISPAPKPGAKPISPAKSRLDAEDTE